MLRILAEIARDEDAPPGVRKAAAADLLDRAGVDRTIQIDLTVNPFDDMIAGAIASVPDGTEVLGPDYSRRINGTDDVIEGELVDEPDEPEWDYGDDVSHVQRQKAAPEYPPLPSLPTMPVREMPGSANPMNASVAHVNPRPDSEYLTDDEQRMGDPEMWASIQRRNGGPALHKDVGPRVQKIRFKD
jgi:hypothetical protein